jgi:hypothetical protein
MSRVRSGSNAPTLDLQTHSMKVVVMDGPDTNAIPAAWYADPGDEGQLRYWDGANWTDRLAVLVQPPAAPAPSVLAPAEPEEQLSYFSHPPPFEESSIRSTYVPLSRLAAVGRTEFAPEHVRSADTAAIWLLTLLPLILLTELAVPLDNQPLTIVTRLGIVGIFIAVSIMLAAWDRSQLLQRGYHSTPPAVLAVVPPFHVLARLIAVGARGLIVGFVGLVVQTAVAIALSTVLGAVLASIGTSGPDVAPDGLVPPFTAVERAALLHPDGMAAKILYDSENSSPNYDSVDCEPLPSTSPGSVTTCTGQTVLASYVIQVQVAAQSDEVPFTVISVTPTVGG